MEIHKPKPWHGWREFLKEYLIIVVGVLTALALEQGVEKMREQRLSREAREAVRAELDLDLASARQRETEQACIHARFALVERALATAERGGASEPIAYLGRPVVPVIYDQRWQAATAGGRTSLLPTDEQRDFARIYVSLERMVANGEKELAAWSRMRALEGAQRPSPDTLARVREALSEARALDYAIGRGLEAARRYGTRIGIEGKTPIVQIDARRMPSVCVPPVTPREQVQALTQDAVGAP